MSLWQYNVYIAGLDVLPLQGIVVLCCFGVGFSSKCQGSEALQQLSIPCTLKGFFFFLLKLDFSWMSINCFHSFFKCSDREGSLIIKEQSKDLQEVSNDQKSISNYFIRST